MKQTALSLLSLIIVSAILAGCNLANQETEPLEDNPSVTETSQVEATPKATAYNYIASQDNLSIFAQAIQQADLIATLEQNEITVFAPSDDAFNALGDETLNQLLADQTQLKQLVQSHVIANDLDAAYLSENTSIAAIDGEGLVLGISDTGLTVNDANITHTNIRVGNSIIHMIDRVIGL